MVFKHIIESGQIYHLIWICPFVVGLLLDSLILKKIFKIYSWEVANSWHNECETQIFLIFKFFLEKYAMSNNCPTSFFQKNIYEFVFFCFGYICLLGTTEFIIGDYLFKKYFENVSKIAPFIFVLLYKFAPLWYVKYETLCLVTPELFYLFIAD